MASNYFVRVKGKKQGDFKGEMGKNQTEIPILGFAYAVVSPRDPLSGLPTGQRQHKPVTIMKEWGPASVQFFSAMAANEDLTTVVIREMRAGLTGISQVYMEIRLTNANIAGIQIDPQRVDNLPVWTKEEIEQISFTFQRIEIEDFASNSSATDDWEGRV